jgi:hypothetical protein
MKSRLHPGAQILVTHSADPRFGAIRQFRVITFRRHRNQPTAQCVTTMCDDRHHAALCLTTGAHLQPTTHEQPCDS